MVSVTEIHDCGMMTQVSTCYRSIVSTWVLQMGCVNQLVIRFIALGWLFGTRNEGVSKKTIYFDNEAEELITNIG